MKEKISGKDYTLISSMLFGMFFGAGNLIFPLILGAKAGKDMPLALLGMLVSAVGFPLLGIISMGISKSEGLLDMAGRVSKGFAYFFTCALYLTIGPFFAIPRCGATSFAVGFAPLSGEHKTLFQLIFTLLFFAAVLIFSLRPSKITDTVGKWLNPIFLLLLSVLVFAVLLRPANGVSQVPVSEDYARGAVFSGFLQGYDTLDVLASLAFGIIVINVIRGYGVENPSDIAKSTVKSGVFSMTFMAVIYAVIALAGTECYSLYADRLSNPDFTGGDAFSVIAEHYFGRAGLVILALTVTFCCLKTAVGLVTSCSETFVEMFPKGPKYKTYAVGFSVFSFAVSNIGLSNIISFSAPVLYLLYPLAIVLVLLNLFGKFFKNRQCVFVTTMLFTGAAALCDLIRVSGIEALSGTVSAIGRVLPLYGVGMGWILPSAAGLLLGLFVSALSKPKTSAAR